MFHHVFYTFSNTNGSLKWACSMNWHTLRQRLAQDAAYTSFAYTCNDMMPSFYLKCHHWDMKSRLPTDCFYKWKLYSYFIQRIRRMAQNLILAVKYTLWKNMNIQLTFVVELELWSQFTKASLRGSKTAYL